jgi:NAD(P)-dependent dehydrogenase (short-subunit alcohol dehydrogenase family)
MSAILLTGGAGNLGKTVVQSLHEAGHSLHLAVMSETDNIHNMGLKYTVDLANKEKADAFVAQVIHNAGLVNGGVFLAGGFVPGGLDKLNIEDINKMILLNFTTAFHVALNLIQHFKNTGGGKLIFIGAKAAMDTHIAVQNQAYALSKQLLYNFSNLVNESGKVDNISAHILLPNTLDTELNRSLMPDADFSQWTKPSDIAGTIRNIMEGKETNTVTRF